MASRSSSSVPHTEYQETTNIDSEEQRHIVHMPPSMTTVASFSSSHSELHLTLNKSEEDQFLNKELEEQQLSAPEEYKLTVHELQSAAISTDFLSSHDELHRVQKKRSEAQEIVETASEEKAIFDDGSEEQLSSNEELVKQQAHNIGSNSYEKASGIPHVDPEQEGNMKHAVTNPPVDKNEEYIKGIKLYLVLGALTIVYFLVMLDNTILATAIPYITDEFNSLLDVGWYASAYQLASSALQPLGGKVYSKLDSKWSFLVYLILFEVGSAVCGAATSSTMLIGGRALAGAGGSGLLNGALIIINSCIPPHRQPALVGILMGLGQLGNAFGPLIGGAFTQYVTWRWCFYVNLPIGGVVCLAIVFIRIPDHIEKPSIRNVFHHVIMEFDLPGFALFAPAAVMLFLALQYGGNQYRWDSSQVLGLFCGAGMTFIAWLIWEFYQGDNAMVPYSMMRRRVMWAGCVASLFLGGTVFVTGYYLPIYFQAVLDYSPFMSGVDVLPNILSQMVFGIISGALVQRIGYFPPFILLGTALNAVGCGILALFTPYTSSGHWIGYQILMGAGRGLTMAVPFLVIQNALPKEMIPTAMSTLVFLQNFGAAVMIVLGQTILTNSLVTLIPQYAQGVDPQVVINAGTTSSAIVRAVGLDKLPGVLWAYSKALQRVWYFTGGIAVPPFVVGWCFSWENIRKKAEETSSQESSEALKG